MKLFSFSILLLLSFVLSAQTAFLADPDPSLFPEGGPFGDQLVYDSLHPETIYAVAVADTVYGTALTDTVWIYSPEVVRGDASMSYYHQVNYPTDIYYATFRKGIDGDSFYLDVEVPSTRGNRTHRVRSVECRLFRADTPEMADTYYGARKAKHFTETTLLDAGRFRVKYWGKGPHDRWLVTVLLDETTLRDLLDEAGHLTGKYESARAPKRRLN